MKRFLTRICEALSWPVPAAELPDQDLNDLFESKTATGWKHIHVCTECQSPVGHNEFMTRICLTCGQKMPRIPSSGAVRSVVRHGRWVRQQSTGLLEVSSGVWRIPDDYDARCKP